MQDEIETAEENAVLRSLALKAVGMTGADIERLVREARQTARRQKRPLAYDDIKARLDAGKPKRSEASRWRRAVHEAGHAVARHHLGLGTVELVTINGASGKSYVDGQVDVDADMEDVLTARIVSMLAGRAAEEIVLGKPGLGSGGSEHSDLAKATEIALALETIFGTSRKHPLLHVKTVFPHNQTATTEIAKAVNKRLEEAYKKALEIARWFKAVVLQIAKELLALETLDRGKIQKCLKSIVQVGLSSSCVV